MSILPRFLIEKLIDDEVEVSWDQSGTRNILLFLATDGTGIALSIAPAIARKLQADIAQIARAPAPGAPVRKT